MSTNMVQLDTSIASLVTAYHHVIASRCLTFAGFTVLIFDHALTFSQEVTQVWSRPTNIVSVLFLVNRYATPIVLAFDLYDKSGLASSLTLSFCRTWLVVEGFLVVTTFSIIHGLVALRVSALHGQSCWITIVLVVAYLTYIVVTFTLVGLGIIPMSHNNIPTAPFNICIASIPPDLWVVWLPSLFFESLMVILTVVRVIRTMGCHISRSTPVAHLLYRDGILYFLVMASSSMLCLLDWIIAPPTLNALAKYFAHAICVCASSRLVLNLRGLSPNAEIWTTIELNELGWMESVKTSSPFNQYSDRMLFHHGRLSATFDSSICTSQSLSTTCSATYTIEDRIDDG